MEAVFLPALFSLPPPAPHQVILLQAHKHPLYTILKFRAPLRRAQQNRKHLPLPQPQVQRSGPALLL